MPGKHLGFSGVANSVGATTGPFEILMEDANGTVTKTNLNSIQDVVTIVATDALTAAEHAGRVNLLGEVGGDAAVTLTLPAATGSGARYEFIVSVVNTSNYVIQVDSASATMEGLIVGAADGGNTVNGWESGASDDTITLNGTTTGGAAIGDWVTLIDMGTNLWHVRGQITQTGTEATPFSAAVS